MKIRVKSTPPYRKQVGETIWICEVDADDEGRIKKPEIL
jgi:hypothetical protein